MKKFIANLKAVAHMLICWSDIDFEYSGKAGDWMQCKKITCCKCGKVFYEK